MPADATSISVPHDRRARFFSRGQWITILAVGVLVTVVVTSTYLRSLGAGFDVNHARAIAVVAGTLATAKVLVSETQNEARVENSARSQGLRLRIYMKS